MTATTTIHFIRHGEVHNPEDIYYGRLPGFYLSARGRLQAKATGQTLGEPKLNAIFTSPMERAVETAEIIASEQGEVARVLSDAILEVHSPFDGQPISLLAANNWDIYSGTEPPFEQPADILGRVQDFVAQVREDYQGQRVALVTHGDIVMFMSLWAKELPLDADAKQALYYPDYLGHASVSTFTYQTKAAAEIPGFNYMPTPYDGA